MTFCTCGHSEDDHSYTGDKQRDHYCFGCEKADEARRYHVFTPVR